MWSMTRTKKEIKLDRVLVEWWRTSMDARAVRVRKDIIKGIFWCRNSGFNTDIDYLESDTVLLDSIKRCGYKFDVAGDFT